MIHCHNDATTIPHDSTLAGVLVPSQRTLDSVPANMTVSASLPLAKTRNLHNSANSPYFGQVAVLMHHHHSHVTPVNDRSELADSDSISFLLLARVSIHS
jgi:hypothetical protein